MATIAKVGTKIKNGALVLRSYENIVLCLFNNQYVTWNVMLESDSSISAYWGDYLGQDEQRAFNAYDLRVAELKEHK